MNISNGRAYTIEYKMEVVKFAETHTNRETGSIKLMKSMVRKWKQQKVELQELCEQSVASRKKWRLEVGERKHRGSIK